MSKTGINTKLNLDIKFYEIIGERKNFIRKKISGRIMRLGSVPEGLTLVWFTVLLCTSALSWLCGSQACVPLITADDT